LSNKKSKERKGKVQLINATELHTALRKSEGNKRREISAEQIRQIVETYSAFETTKESLILAYEDFGYRKVKVLRPLRMKVVISQEGLAKLQTEKAWERLTADQQTAWSKALAAHMDKEHSYGWIETFAKEASKRTPALGKVGKPFVKALLAAFGVRDPEADEVTDDDGHIIPDDELTDFENVPLGTEVEEYIAQEVLPHAADAYIDDTYRDEKDGKVGVVGYEINFNRYFYEFKPPRDLDEIDAELKAVEAEIAAILAEVTE